MKLDAERDLRDLGLHCKVIDGCQDLDSNTKAFGLSKDFKEGVVRVRARMRACGPGAGGRPAWVVDGFCRRRRMLELTALSL